MVLLAGCVGTLDLDGDDNKAPVARLTADVQQTWTGEPVTFDLSGSYDPDGRIRHYLLDLGDGTTQEFGPEDDLEVTHTYTRGAAYEVRLTVTDDGQDGSGSATDDKAIALAINERTGVQGQVVKTGNLTGNLSEEQDVFFGVSPDPVAYAIDLNVTNLLAIGASEVEITVLDPVGAQLAQRTLSLASGETQMVHIEGNLTQAGQHALHLKALQGGADVEGDVSVLYA